MKIIEINNIDWVKIRTTLSVALLKDQDIEIINAGSYFVENPQFQIYFDDLVLLIEKIGAGTLEIIENGSVKFFPKSVDFGKLNFNFSEFSSILDYFIFLMPSLFSKKFRSVLRFTGVTHGENSISTAFFKDTLLPTLEKFGFYGSLNLERFGFYGTGGGVAELRIYPKEAVENSFKFNFENFKVDSARIYISHLSAEVAKRQKEYISKKLQLDLENISILEIQASNGVGNVIQISKKNKNFNLIESVTIDGYNSFKDMIYKEEESYLEIDKLIFNLELNSKSKISLSILPFISFLPNSFLSEKEFGEMVKVLNDI